MRKQKYTILGTLLALSISGQTNAAIIETPGVQLNPDVELGGTISGSEYNQAQACVVQPTCESLGYTQATSACVNSNYTACPFDTTKVKCHQTKSCQDLGYIYTSSNSPCEKTAKCPYDSAQLMCVSNPVVGDFKYSFKTEDHKGWWKVDGRYISSVAYASVYNLFGETFPSASKLSVLTPFIYAGVDYDAAYASYMKTIDTIIQNTINPEDLYFEIWGTIASYNEIPGMFRAEVDYNENEIIYENTNGPETKENVTEKIRADNYVDELSLNILGYIDPDTNLLIVGAHHDFSEESLYGIVAGSRDDLSSFFKLTATERYNLKQKYTTLGSMYAKKCMEAAQMLKDRLSIHIESVRCGKNFTAECIEVEYTPYALSDATESITGSNGYAILPPSGFMQKMSKLVHGWGISGLQKGLHYLVHDVGGTPYAYLWDGEGFTTHKNYYTGIYNTIDPTLNSLLYPGVFPTSSTQGTTSQTKSNFPDYHFYCVYDIGL